MKAIFTLVYYMRLYCICWKAYGANQLTMLNRNVDVVCHTHKNTNTIEFNVLDLVSSLKISSFFQFVLKKCVVCRRLESYILCGNWCLIALSMHPERKRERWQLKRTYYSDIATKHTHFMARWAHRNVLLWCAHLFLTLARILRLHLTKPNNIPCLNVHRSAFTSKIV